MGVCLASRFATLALLRTARGCSFLVASYNLSAHHTDDVVRAANELQRHRGPDATNRAGIYGWSFLHNLLSMTGRPTLQPFNSNDGMVVVLFNGEIYNFRELSVELGMTLEPGASDGVVLLPAYAQWQDGFFARLRGEFAIVLVDFRRRVVLMASDAFLTKPLWYAQYWPTAAATGEKRLLIASYESALKGLGAPDGSRHLARPNEVLRLSFGAGGSREFSRSGAWPLVTWNLTQHKNHTRDWAAAFERAVASRTRGLKHRAFIGLSSG